MQELTAQTIIKIELDYSSGCGETMAEDKAAAAKYECTMEFKAGDNRFAVGIVTGQAVNALHWLQDIYFDDGFGKCILFDDTNFTHYLEIIRNAVIIEQ